MATGRVHSLKLASSPPPKGRVHSVAVQAQALGFQPSKGRVHRTGLQFSTPNREPVVSVSPTNLKVGPGDRYVLTGYDSDPDGTVVSRQWVLDGAVVGLSGVLNVKAPVPPRADRLQQFTFTATDDDGLSKSASATVTTRRADVVKMNPDGSLVGLVIHIDPWDPGGSPITAVTVKLPTVALAYTDRFVSVPVAAGVGTATVAASSDQPFTVIVETSNVAGSGYTEVGRSESSFAAGRNGCSFVQPISAAYVRVIIVCGPTDQTDLTADLTVTTGT